MKKFCITFLLFLILVVSVICLNYPKETNEYLRIHVRANSNLEVDQNVKYKVKDAVVEFLTPYIAECDTKQKAQQMLEENKEKLTQVANAQLKKEGFSYSARVEIKQEIFPTRVYKNLTLDSGIYDAIILYLGEGTGDNWWCVVYPPLCFTGEGQGYVIKSKIAEIIDNFFMKNIKEE